MMSPDVVVAVVVTTDRPTSVVVPLTWPPPRISFSRTCAELVLTGYRRQSRLRRRRSRSRSTATGTLSTACSFVDQLDDARISVVVNRTLTPMSRRQLPAPHT